VPDLQEIRRVELGGAWSMGWIKRERLATITGTPTPGAPYLLRSWPLDGGEPRTLARLAPRP
jgi:hypothetical protein